MSDKRRIQLKFISNIFNMSLKEIKDTLGFETLTMIFRRVGEESGKNVVKKMKGRYQTPEQFLALLLKEVIEPVIDVGQAKFEINGNNVKIELDACPYKKAGGFPIQDMSFFCDYTEGLFDTALKEAFPDRKFIMDMPKDLISKPGCKQCIFNGQYS